MGLFKFGKKEAALAAGVLVAGGAMANQVEKDVKTIEISSEQSGKLDDQTISWEQANSKDSLKLAEDKAWYEANKVWNHESDSTTREVIGEKSLYFGAELLDSVAEANNVKVEIDRDIDYVTLEKELSKPSIFEGLSVKEALDSGLYMVYMVPNKINGQDPSFENIKTLFGAKHISGENIGNREDNAQRLKVAPGLYLAPTAPAFDSASLNSQLGHKPRNLGLADYNEALFMLLAKKAMKLPAKETEAGRVINAAKIDKSKWVQKYYPTLSNKYVLYYDGQEVSAGAFDNSMAEDLRGNDLGVWLNLNIPNNK